eukprot:1139667-Pelagomonas_calceolata.AAC.5
MAAFAPRDPTDASWAFMDLKKKVNARTKQGCEGCGSLTDSSVQLCEQYRNAYRKAALVAAVPL